MRKCRTDAPSEDSERRGRFAKEVLMSLLEDKRISQAFGDTDIKLVWKEGELQRVEITDHTTYK
jgi:hypothetical protein